jgi:hypothetical protein
MSIHVVPRPFPLSRSIRYLLFESLLHSIVLCIIIVYRHIIPTGNED